jgi:hypothetical protein
MRRSRHTSQRYKLRTSLTEYSTRIWRYRTTVRTNFGGRKLGILTNMEVLRGRRRVTRFNTGRDFDSRRAWLSLLRHGVIVVRRHVGATDC